MRLSVAISCIALMSCTSPYPISIPQRSFETGSISYDKNTGEYKNTETNQYIRIANSVKIYELQLHDKVKALALQKYGLSDFGVLGTLTSVVAAASGAVTTALYAGGAALGGGVASQRYNYDAQIANYRLIQEKLNCIYRSMTDLNTSQLSVAIKNDGNSVVSEILRPYVNGVLSDLTFALESEQLKVNLIAPDVKAIAAAVSEQDSAVSKIKGLSPEKLFSDNNDFALSVAELIRTNINMCLVSPTTKPVTVVLAK